ncbi:MAG: hypothetical protein ACI8UR_001580 [Natronomonas sp.]|jgi:hypothetical protein
MTKELRSLEPLDPEAIHRARKVRPICSVRAYTRMSQREDSSVPLSWIAIFLLLALGLGAAAVLAVGGDILPMVAPI